MIARAAAGGMACQLQVAVASTEAARVQEATYQAEKVGMSIVEVDSAQVQFYA